MPSVNERRVLEVLEVADVMGDERPAVLADTEGALELRPACEHRAGEERPGGASVAGARGPRERRNRSSRPPKETGDGVVGACMDRPVVDEEVDPRSVPVARARQRRCRRWARPRTFAAGEDERAPPAGGKGGGAAGCTEASRPGTGCQERPTGRPQHPSGGGAARIGRPRAGQKSLLGWIDETEALEPARCRRPSRRMACPPGACGSVAPPRPRRRRRLRQQGGSRRVPFRAKTSPAHRRARRGSSSGVAVDCAPVSVDQPQGRSAIRAAERLGVEAPVCRIVVLAGAFGTHGEGPPLS